MITNHVRGFCYGFDWSEDCVKIVIRTPRYERLSTCPNACSGVTSFLAVEGIGLIRTESLELGKYRVEMVLR